MSIKATYSILVKFLVVIGFSTLIYTPLFSQEPSYSRIGEEELADMDIYSIIQDKQGYIWLSTNRDLVKYDGYTFRHISNTGTGTKSLFGLTKDNLGNIFCFSLGGEIFTIRNDSLILYFTIPDSLHNIEQSIFFDEQNRLTVCGKHFFQINSSLQINLIYNSKNAPASSSAGITTPDGKNLIGNSYGNFIQYLSNGKLENYVVDSKINKGFLPYSNGKNIYLQPYNEFILYINSNKSYSKIPLDLSKIPQNVIARNIYVSENGLLWFPTRAGGIYVFYPWGKQMFNGNKIFSSFFISGFLEDREGNYWFSTLGKGLIYIPNPNIYSYQNNNILKNEILTEITTDDIGNLYIGCESGCIIEKNTKGEFRYLITDLGKKINVLKYFSNENALVFEYNNGLGFYNITTQQVYKEIKNTGSVKEIFHTGNNNYTLGSSIGIINSTSLNNKLTFNRRISRLYYHLADSSSWIISPIGLYRINHQGISEKLTTYGTFPIDIDGYDKRIWIATAENGIIEIENQKITKYLTTTNGLTGKQIRRILIREPYLFITHEQGLQIYDIHKGTIQSINISHGLHSNYIIDLEYKNELISIVTQKGLQQFLLSDVNNNSTVPTVNITAIKIENEIYTPSQFIHSGKYYQPFEVFFSSGAYQHKGKLQYVYRLKGRSDDWDTTSYEQNHVRYESLSPGKYTFELRALNENNISSEVISFEYTVIPPVWQRWWFYILIVIVILVIVFFIYKWQLTRIERKNKQKNELISSRLTALKSQMNPHFIFNSLNSIQDLVLRQETEKSYDYIVKFSDLVRQTLNYSDKDFIDFEDEIKLLSVYLELEKLRFQDEFKYRIEKINIEEIEVPPMLVQPFVENAIKHGLLHKSGQKELTIVFEQTDVLTCTIIDNGVGRNKAREIKERQNKAHESFSVQAIKSRFEIMQDLYKSALGVEYEDMYENDTSTGTKVILRLPFKPKY